MQVIEHQVEQFLVGAIDQGASAADHKAQVAALLVAALGEDRALVEEPLRGGADKADEGAVGNVAVKPDVNANYRGLA